MRSRTRGGALYGAVGESTDTDYLEVFLEVRAGGCWTWLLIFGGWKGFVLRSEERRVGKECPV